MGSEAEEYPHSKGSTVRRLPKRASYDKDLVNRILDENIVGHVGFVDAEGSPIVIPMLFARDDETLILHGSTAARILKLMAAGSRICVSVASVQDLVVSLTPFHNSNNYRSAVLFGTGSLIEDADKKLAAMRILTNKLIPGRWPMLENCDGRLPNNTELKATTVILFKIEEASAKMRDAPPSEDAKDLEDPALAGVWSGLIPIRSGYDVANATPARPGIPMPEYLQKMT